MFLLTGDERAGEEVDWRKVVESLNMEVSFSNRGEPVPTAVNVVSSIVGMLGISWRAGVEPEATLKTLGSRIDDRLGAGFGGLPVQLSMFCKVGQRVSTYHAQLRNLVYEQDLSVPTAASGVHRHSQLHPVSRLWY